MYLFIGLPLESNIDIEDEVKNIKLDTNIDIITLNIPIFTNLCISSCSMYDDLLTKIEKDCSDLVKQFSNNKKYLLEFNQKNMSWDNEKYGSTNIDESIQMVNDDLKHIKNLYQERREEHLIYKKEHDDIIRKTEGTLAERDISFTINTEYYEFLEAVFVVINKEYWDRYIEFINKSEIASIETLEKITEDDTYVLSKLLILKTDVKTFKKECSAYNFIIKDVHKYEKGSVEKKIKEIDEKKGCLEVFINTHFTELYKIFVHIKLMKLYVESFCRYGLPKNYVFFVCTGDNLLYKFKKICENWRSDRVVEESDEEEDQCETNYAHTIIEVNTKEE